MIAAIFAGRICEYLACVSFPFILSNTTYYTECRVGVKNEVPQEPNMRSILITGGAGFIGSHLVDRLLAEEGWQVTVIDDFNDFYDPSIKRANIQPHLSISAFKLVEADIRDYDRTKKVFRETGFDCMVHLAARAGVRPSLKEPRLYVETNINGTLNLLE